MAKKKTAEKKIAKKKKVIIGINLEEITGTASEEKSEVIARIRQNVELCKKNKLNSFKFHVLGGANLIDILYHQLFSKHIKEFHGIDCLISYDSSSVFKGAFNGRYINTIKEDGSIVKMSFKSNEMHIRYDNNFTVEEKMYDVLNRVASLHNIKLLDPKEVPIYDSVTGTLSRQVTNYLLLEVLQLYKDVEEESKILSEQLYKTYQTGSVENFNKQALEITKKFNQGKNKFPN